MSIKDYPPGTKHPDIRTLQCELYVVALVPCDLDTNLLKICCQFSETGTERVTISYSFNI